VKNKGIETNMVAEILEDIWKSLQDSERVSVMPSERRSSELG